MVTKEATETEWLTTTQAGKLLGVSGMTINRMCKTGKLRSIRPTGSQYRIQRSVVEHYLSVLSGESEAPKQPSPAPTPIPPKPVLKVRQRPAVIDRIRQAAAKSLN